MQKVLIIGGASRAALAFRRRASLDSSLALTVALRQDGVAMGGERLVVVADYFDPPADILAGMDVVINFAGITHSNDRELLDRVNATGPARLALAARAQTVPHFIHLSSLHVYERAHSVALDSLEAPTTPYGQSKLQADRALAALRQEGFAVSILRPPMLYGGGSGDNLRKLAVLLAKTSVFPVRRTPAPRSLLHVDNLAAVLQTMVRCPIDSICFAADDAAFTLGILVDAMKKTIGRGPRLIPLPDLAFLPLRMIATESYNKIFEPNLVVPEARIVTETPLPVLLHEGLEEMLADFYGGRFSVLN